MSVVKDVAEMGRYLLILGCSKRKKKLLVTPIPALERYDGPAFRVIRKWQKVSNEDHCLDIKVISAKYGLLDIKDNIPYYDQQMTVARAAELKQSVAEKLLGLLRKNNYSCVYCDVGSVYLKALPDELIESNELIEFAKGRIGERLSNLKRRLLSLPGH